MSCHASHVPEIMNVPIAGYMQMVQATALTRMPPNQAQQTRFFAIPHNRPVAGKARGSPARASSTCSPAYNASPAVCSFLLISESEGPTFPLDAAGCTLLPPDSEVHDRQAGMRGFLRSVLQHLPSAVPSKPLGGFSKEPVKQEAPAAVAEPLKYNQMAPPVTAYTAEYALAKASAAMDGNRHQVPTTLLGPACRYLLPQQVATGRIRETSRFSLLPLLMWEASLETPPSDSTSLLDDRLPVRGMNCLSGWSLASQHCADAGCSITVPPHMYHGCSIMVPRLMYHGCSVTVPRTCLQAIPPPQPDRRPFFSGQARELDEEAAKRSAAAAQQLGSAIGNPASIGAKLMSKMGFGVAGQGLGRSGQVRPPHRPHKGLLSHKRALDGIATGRWALRLPGRIWAEPCS